MICEACQGTGIEEGREWDGCPCVECKGAGRYQNEKGSVVDDQPIPSLKVAGEEK